MEMVSASKMRRAQQRVLASRPYAERLEQVIGDLAALQLGADELAKFPLLKERPVTNAAVILITPDKGLTGPLISNVLRRAGRFMLDDAGVPVRVIASGRKGRDFVVRSRQSLVAEFTGWGDNPTLDSIRPMVEIAIADFIAGEVDAVHIVYPRFVNTLSQVPEVRQVLPIKQPQSSGMYSDYIFEPSPDAVLEQLLPRYVQVQVYQAMLDAIASEHSARMVAMRNASENAKELVGDLTLTYNKARQAQITREVSEIAAGAEAMKG
jgi:F-type H+-transporting ATPase subunit gamma